MMAREQIDPLELQLDEIDVLEAKLDESLAETAADLAGRRAPFDTSAATDLEVIEAELERLVVLEQLDRGW